jgi:hypothetical protein
MDIFEKLDSVANSTESLDNFIFNNIDSIDDFHNTQYLSVNNFKESFDRFVSLKFYLIENLDFSKSYNKAFITILLEFSERYNITLAIIRFYSIIEQNKINYGTRLEAGLLYLYNIDSNSTIIERFDKICNLIDKSISSEEDNDTKSICTFLNYFANVIINTPSSFTARLIDKINYALLNNNYNFLSNPSILHVLKFDLSDPESCFLKIQNVIDKLLNKNNLLAHFKNEQPKEEKVFIERETNYALAIMSCNKEFNAIRNISVNKVSRIVDKDKLFYSLGRGVSVLEKEEQLFLYMNSFGKMHYEKLISAYEKIPENIVRQNINLIDWGCGQGLASISFFDYFKNNNVKNVVLIEPSQLAIKRAALHVEKYNNEISIKTINKDLDSLNNNDLSGFSTNSYFHLFSNILDIDLFSLKSLVDKIESNFKGKNYFVCVSPYITDIKTNRLDAFMSNFSSKHNFKLYASINNKSGEWKNNNWSRVIRVFEVVI